MLIFNDAPTPETVQKAGENGDIVVLRFESEEDNPSQDALRDFLRSRGFDPDESGKHMAVFVSPPSETREEFQARVAHLYEHFIKPCVEEEQGSTVDAVMGIDTADEEPPEWLTTYTARLFDVWQLQHGFVADEGREAMSRGVATWMFNRPPLDDIGAENLNVAVVRVFFGILAFCGSVEWAASDCLTRIVFRCLSSELGIARHYNELYDAGDKSGFMCPCQEL